LPLETKETFGIHIDFRKDLDFLLLVVMEEKKTLKVNDWNLQPSPMKRKEHDLNQTCMILFQPLIFRAVFR